MWCTFALTAFAKSSERPYSVDFTITLLPDQNVAKVSIYLEDGSLLRLIDFHIKADQHSDLKADGKLSIVGDRAIWTPPKGPATFSLTAKINHQRKNMKYDSRMTSDWAIFRGDDLIPAAKVDSIKGATSRAKLHFVLPHGWTTVETGWPRESDGSFVIDNPKRHFDRPVGWMIAGKISTQNDIIEATEISVGEPIGSSLKRMEILTFFNLVWDEVQLAFRKLPRKLLVVGAGDPMWRGALSAPNSLFMHADRPIISENGTSTLLHELTHVVTRIRGKMNDDWIAEGLAEFYSTELIYRAGGMTDSRYQKVRNWLKQWSINVTTLRVVNSKGPISARAVILLQDLDREIQTLTNKKHNIDDVTRELMELSKVSLDDLRRISENLVEGKLKTLNTPLLK